MSRTLAVAAVAFVVLPVGSAAADTATTTLSGNPMTVFLGNQGGLQANVGGSATNVFFPPTSNTGNAGFFLGFPAAVGRLPAGSVAGPPAGGATTVPWTAVSQSGVTGAGTSTDPLRQGTNYRLNDGQSDLLDVSQGTTYVHRRRRFTMTYGVFNLTNAPIRFRASIGADLFLEGSDVGVGFFDPGFPRFVGGINRATGVAGGIQEGTNVREAPAWSHYFEGVFSDVFQAIGDPAGPGFNDTVNPAAVDNGVGVQWDDRYSQAPLFPGRGAVYEVVWNFGSPPPRIGRAVNVEVLSGNVGVSLPPATARAAARVPGLRGRNFVPLEQARQIPVRSILDTRKGRIRLTSARNSSGRTQAGVFSGGVFQVLQSRRRRSKGLVELRLRGSSFRRCRLSRSSRGSDAQSSRRRRLSRRARRRLRGRARGRYRTRGRHSSATVRGTTWTVTDRCDGTLTSVRSGRVTVRDFRRRRNIRLRRGQRYLARARR
jgi:hypothetical protein